MSEWLEKARLASVRDTARALEMWERGRRWGPCPVATCRAGEGWSRNDRRRGPVWMNGADRRWTCWSCNGHGDAIDLVSYRLNGVDARSAGGEGMARIQAWFEGRGSAMPERQVRPARRRKRQVLDRDALEPLFGTPASRRPALRAWLASRELAEGCPAFALPRSDSALWGSRPWWPRWWADSWPLAVPAYDAKGALRSLHGRRVRDDVIVRHDGRTEVRACRSGAAHSWERGTCTVCELRAAPKSRWPRGVSSTGLVFADPWVALPALREARWKGVRALCFVEGLPDYLSAACEARETGNAVIGIESGSASALRDLSLPKGLSLVIATHADPAGDQYAERLQAELIRHHGRMARRAPLANR